MAFVADYFFLCRHETDPEKMLDLLEKLLEQTI